MRSVTVLIVVLGLCLTPATLQAWGMDVHRFLTRRAVDGLPAEIRPFFAAEREFIGEHAADPDLWRVVGLMSERGPEDPNHFLDIDGLDEPAPFTNVPREWDAYVARYGEERANRMGRLPWRTDDIYQRLVTAFRQIGEGTAPYAKDNARYLVAVLSHYIEDAHVPFHAAVNYDGQLTNQRGVHARFETALVLRNLSTFTLQPVTIRPIANVRDYIFETLIEGQALVDPILAADRKAAGEARVYGAAYFATFRSDVGAIAERRLSAAASGVASVVVAAWIDAGRPSLSRP